MEPVLCYLEISSLKRHSSAEAHVDYITRGGTYDPAKLRNSKRDDCLRVESINMPDWTVSPDVLQSDLDRSAAKLFWIADDSYERLGGRLGVKLICAIPRNLTTPQQIRLARRFALRVSKVSGGSLPLTWALHAGKGRNPHLHILVNERINDGYARTPREWFLRASVAPKPVQSGGARKSRELTRDWIAVLRADWSELANQELQAAGLTERMDPRSYLERGIVSTPGQHEGHGPGAEERRAANSRLKEINKEIAALTAELDELMTDTDDDEIAADATDVPDSVSLSLDSDVPDEEPSEVLDSEPEWSLPEHEDFTTLEESADDADDDSPDPDAEWATEH